MHVSYSIVEVFLGEFMRVLVIEDDASVRETLGMVLEAYQHQPILVADGEKAVELLERDWPDVMLLDLSLPGMSGEEVFEHIMARFGRVPPTVVISAVQQAAARVQRLPGARFLAKPYTLEQLDACIREAATSQAGAA
jgi:DNA-binding response OmpR family regulator